MSKKRIIAVASVAVVCVVVIGIFASGLFREWTAGDWLSDWGYYLSIKTDADIYNVTLYLPVPLVKGDIPTLILDINNSASKPFNWKCEYIDTQYGKMLKISANVITEGYHYIEIEGRADHVINTESPVENEPTFYPRINDTGTNYQCYAYIDFNTSATTNCTIYTDFHASKERGTFYSGKELHTYTDAIKCTTVGEIHSWVVVDGKLREYLPYWEASKR